jgi:hypothetical protein
MGILCLSKFQAIAGPEKNKTANTVIQSFIPTPFFVKIQENEEKR